MARQILQRATERFQAGDSATALSSLAYLLRRQPDHPIAAYRIVAELSSGNYSLPVAALTEDLDTILREVGRFDYAKLRSKEWLYAPQYSQHFSPDSRLVVTSGADDTARTWDAHMGTPVSEPMRHPGPIHSVDFSPDSRRVVTACEDGAVQIWDAQTGHAVGSPFHHGRPVWAARFSPDSQTVATLALDRAVGLWDVRSGRLLWGLETNVFGSPIDVQFSESGERLMASSEERLQIWDTASQEVLQHFKWKEGWATSYSRPELSPDGRSFMFDHSVVALKIGLSHLLKGDSLSPILYFDKTGEGNMDLDDDAYAKIKGEQYLTHLPSSNEIKLILIKNLIDAGKFRIAIDSLEKFIERPMSDSLRAEAILCFSDVLYRQGKFKKSLEYAVAVFNFDECELWVKPFACYYAARASKELKNYIDAEFFIGYAGNFKNYFFENKLMDKLSYLSFLLEEK